MQYIRVWESPDEMTCEAIAEWCKKIASKINGPLASCYRFTPQFTFGMDETPAGDLKAWDWWMMDKDVIKVATKVYPTATADRSIFADEATLGELCEDTQKAIALLSQN